VKPGLNSLINALIKAKENGIHVIFLENGEHTIETEKVEGYDDPMNILIIDFPVTIIGESKDGCTIIGGLKMTGKKEDDVNVKTLTISQSKGQGVYGYEGMSFHLFHLKIEKSGEDGVRVRETNRNTMSNCQVSHSKESGVIVLDGLIKMNGSGTSIHNNVTSGSRHCYGLYTNSSSSIHLVSPLTKESVSINNGGGGNFGGKGTIKTIRLKEEVLCCVNAEGTLHVKPGLNSLSNALFEAKQYAINQIFLEDGVHDEKGGYVVIDFPITIIGESKDGCTIIGGLIINGKEEDDVNVKYLTISQSKGRGVEGYKGMSFHLFHLKIEKSKGDCGVYVNNTKRNTMSNCQVSHSKNSGVLVYDGLLTINGSGTSIHNNVTGGSSGHYGLRTDHSSASIHLVSPLTKESVSVNNGGGGNYDGDGTIKTIKVRSKEEVFCGVDAEGTLHVKPGLNSLFYAVIEANLYDIKKIFLENGVHDEQGEAVEIHSPLTIIGESKDGCTIIGGLIMNGKKEDDVNVKTLTISQSKGNGVVGNRGGQSFHLYNLNIEKSELHGVCVWGDTRNTMSNCQVSHSKGSGVKVGDPWDSGLITINGSGTSIHNNDSYGLCTYDSPSSSIHLVSPLTKESVSINNGGGENYGGRGTIKTIRTKKEVLCCVDEEGTLHVKPGLNSLLNALFEAKQYAINQIFLENGVHNEQGEMVVIDFPVTIIGESKDGCTIIGGLQMTGKEEDDVNVKHLTISQSKGQGVCGSEGMSFHLFHLNIEKSGYSGVDVIMTKRNTMSNCQVSHSKYSGVFVNGGLITINGSGTSIHNNGTGGASNCYGDPYGLKTCTSSSSIHLVSPLTKESVSINNGGGGNYGDEGTIETIEMENDFISNMSEEEAVDEIHGWVKLETDDGKEYYYNPDLNLTQWKPPDEGYQEINDHGEEEVDTNQTKTDTVSVY
jgi:hypothetical protein